MIPHLDRSRIMQHVNPKSLRQRSLSVVKFVKSRTTIAKIKVRA